MSLIKVILVIFLSITYINGLKDCSKISGQLRQHQCELTPQTFEGPFYNNKNPIRSDVREYRPGITLNLVMYFTDPDICEPIPGLWVSIWQCDAVGYYSEYTKVDPTVPFDLSIEHAEPTDNSTFLRGDQQTDQEGKVKFITLHPGWYANRTRHIHFKVYRNEKPIFTGQLYFTEQLSDWLYGVFPYYCHKRVHNKEDIAYTDYGGLQTTIYDIKPLNKNRLNDGFEGQLVIGLKKNSIDFGNGNDIQ